MPTDSPQRCREASLSSSSSSSTSTTSISSSSKSCSIFTRMGWEAAWRQVKARAHWLLGARRHSQWCCRPGISPFPPRQPGVVLPPHSDLSGVQLQQPGPLAPLTLPAATPGRAHLLGLLSILSTSSSSSRSSSSKSSSCARPRPVFF